MNKFEYEKEKILNRIKNLNNITDSPLYDYKKSYIKESLQEAADKIHFKNLRIDLIKEVKESIIEYCGISFDIKELEGFLKLYPQTTLKLIKFGIDTESFDCLAEDIFDFILFEMPAPVHGQKLSDEESNDYLKLLQKVAKFYGFKVI